MLGEVLVPALLHPAIVTDGSRIGPAAVSSASVRLYSNQLEASVSTKLDQVPGIYVHASKNQHTPIHNVMKHVDVHGGRIYYVGAVRGPRGPVAGS